MKIKTNPATAIDTDSIIHGSNSNNRRKKNKKWQSFAAVYIISCRHKKACNKSFSWSRSLWMIEIVLRYVHNVHNFFSSFSSFCFFLSHSFFFPFLCMCIARYEFIQISNASRSTHSDSGMSLDSSQKTVATYLNANIVRIQRQIAWIFYY